MVDAEHITQTVHRYLELVGGGSADDIADLFAGDATVEDPVGGEVHIGRGAIHRFYKNIENVHRVTELLALRVAGHQAAFMFAITVGSGEQRIRIEPIDVMVFNSDGRIASMKAYWSPADMAPA
ncbi:MAG: nuclear transport factor 2 family protein [Mycobacterium sp.]|nr:nuclear transport factor 2 family protein [Mycobacterium sp.]